PLQLYLIGVVASLLGLVVRLDRFVELAARGQGASQVEIGQRALSLAQMLDGLLHVTEEERSDAEFEVPALGGDARGRLDLLLDNFGHLAKSAILAAALCQLLAQLRY